MDSESAVGPAVGDCGPARTSRGEGTTGGSGQPALLSDKKLGCESEDTPQVA